jgi:hypothetical protein
MCPFKSNSFAKDLTPGGVYLYQYIQERLRVGMARYWRGWTEKKLASYQQDQGSSNHCAKYAAASCLNLLYGTTLQGESLVSWLDARPLKGTGRYTILGNNSGSLVYQTANLVRTLAHQQALFPQVRARVGSISSLLADLDAGNLLSLVSLTYVQGNEPVIARGNNTASSLGAIRVVSGHLMILAAHDPEHVNLAGGNTPWGFISSWGSKDALYWMSEEDFRRTWGRWSLFNTITVRTN